MLTTSFIVLHQDATVREQLGFGIVVGEHHSKETITMNVEIIVDGKQVNAVKTIENVNTSYKVLWDKVRNVCPSVHTPNELEWVKLTDEYLSDIVEDDEDEEEETDGEEGIEILDQDEATVLEMLPTENNSSN